MLAHWYTLLLRPDDEPPATGPREVWRANRMVKVLTDKVVLSF